MHANGDDFIVIDRRGKHDPITPERRGLLDDSVEVECDGGTVTVKWDGSGGVVLTGPVQVTLHGTIAEHFFQTCEEH